MTDVKNPKEIEIMRSGGKILATILTELLDRAYAGTKLTDLEKLAMDRITEAGCVPSFTTVDNYRWATCLCVNDGVVHCIPTAYSLKDGDVLTIDIGLIYQGFHSDTAWSKIIGYSRSETGNRKTDESRLGRAEKERFLRVGEETLWQAIKQAKTGNRIGHISRTIQEGIEGNGYHVIKSLVGHGVGRELHEDPQIPGFIGSDIGNTPELKKGMTIAIEIIYAQGTGSVVYDNDDGWTLATRDGSLSAVFEHSVAVDDIEPLVLTKI